VTYPFRAERLILVTCRLASEQAAILCTFALDTGATRSMTTAARASTLGLTLRPSPPVVTASRVERPAEGLLQRIDALGLVRRDFPILVMDLPATAGIDGLLGLDFLRDTRLTIDFRAGILSVT
jgi:hypothetical protein